MYHNPVQGKWSLADDFTKYVHSSAAFYELGEVAKAPVFHYKDLGKEDVSVSQASTSSLSDVDGE